jgi:hypothetical protein
MRLQGTGNVPQILRSAGSGEATGVAVEQRAHALSAAALVARRAGARHRRGAGPRDHAQRRHRQDSPARHRRSVAVRRRARQTACHDSLPREVRISHCGLAPSRPAAGLGGEGQTLCRGCAAGREHPAPPAPRPSRVERRSCRWPVGDPRSSRFFFCGAQAAHNKPYCAEHCARAYLRPRAPPDNARAAARESITRGQGDRSPGERR